MIEPQSAPVVNLFAESERLFMKVIRSLQGRETLNLSHGDVEEWLRDKGNELLREMLQGHFDLRKEQEVREAAVTGADGIRRSHVRESSRGLESIFGGVEVKRLEYSARGTASLHPLDAELNLPEHRHSDGLCRRICEEVAKGSYDDAVDSVTRSTAGTVAKAQAEALVVKAAADFDAFYAARRSVSPAATLALAPTSEILVIQADGKGIVMRHEDLREGTRKAAAKAKRKLKKRLTKGEKRNRKRMTTVAAVYTISPFFRTPEEIVGEFRTDAERPARPRPERKRVWASVAKEPEEVLREAFAEALGRDPERKKTWVALVDGNATQIELLQKLAEEFDVKLTIILDVIHAIEYLWDAAAVLHKAGTTQAEAWVTERLRGVLNGNAGYVAGGMRHSATNRGLPVKERKALDTCAQYLLNHTWMLRYHEYLAAGFPIATGVIEGACRHLVKDRMDITGARWSLDGAEAVLKLRALRSSGDLEAYWRFHERQKWERNYASSYAQPPRRPKSRSRRQDPLAVA